MTPAQVRAAALALPEAVEAPHFHYTSFRIRGKIFATMPPAGGTLHLFVTEQQREQALAMYPAFVEKLYWGERVAGLKLNLAAARPALVKELLALAWAAKAPKKLVSAELNAPSPPSS